MEERFGCDACWPASADAAWAAGKALARERYLVDDSHYIVRLERCERCGQRFLSVFTEVISWTTGEDPQHWIVLPVTSSEAAELERLGSAVTEAAIRAIGPDRRSLRRDWPEGEEPSASWGVGIWVGFHD